MFKSTSMIVLVTSLGFALPAMAGHGGGGMGWHAMPCGHGHMMMDENEDKVISREEFEKRQTERFKEADANGDGTVTSEEFSDFLEAERERRREMREQYMFKNLDSNGDGVISDAETTAHSQKMFERMDRNGDDKIDQSDRAMKYEGKKGDWKDKGHDKGQEMDKKESGKTVTQ